MINWRDIRSQEQLKQFISDLGGVTELRKLEYLDEMANYLEMVRQEEHQQWYGQTMPMVKNVDGTLGRPIRTRQVEEPLLRRKRRSRRGKAGRIL